MENLTPNQLKTKLDAGEDVFLKLWKRGCGPCKLSEPATSRLETNYADQLAFCQINVDDHPEMLQISESEVLPAFFIFKNQKLQEKSLGFKGLKKLDTFVASHLSE